MGPDRLLRGFLVLALYALIGSAVTETLAAEIAPNPDRPVMTSWYDRSSNLIDVHFFDDNTGWAVGERGTILATRDGGETWTPQSGTGEHLYSVAFFDDKAGEVVEIIQFDVPWLVLLIDHF